MVGFVGVGVLFGADLRGADNGVSGVVFVLAASACYATAALLIRRWFSRTDPVALTAAVLSVAAIVFLLFYRLVQNVGAGRASLVTYLAPAVAVLAGVMVLDEQATLAILLGLGLVICGSAVAGRQRGPNVVDVAERRGQPDGVSIQD